PSCCDKHRRTVLRPSKKRPQGRDWPEAAGRPVRGRGHASGRRQRSCRVAASSPLTQFQVCSPPVVDVLHKAFEFLVGIPKLSTLAPYSVKLPAQAHTVLGCQFFDGLLLEESAGSALAVPPRG